MKTEKKFVGELKSGDRVQISKYINFEKVLLTYDITGISWSEENDEGFEYACLSLLGVDTDYVGVQTWYTTETIRVVDNS